jgi:hypothetical protein
MRILAISIMAVLSLVQFSATALADYATPPPSCTVAGITYLWSAPQCADARAAWASAQPTTPPTQAPTPAPATPAPTPRPAITPAPIPLTSVPVAPTAIPPPHIPGSTTVVVPGGTTVDVSLSEQVSSATAAVGDLIAIVVTKDVDSNGWVVIPKGANGQATVTKVDHAGGNGHGGQLALTMDWVFSSDGGKIQLSTVNHNSEEGGNKGAASTATIVSYLLLGPLGLFAHNFVRGKDVTIDTDKVFVIFVDHDVHVDATQRGAAPAGFDQ